jgi:cyclopropane fatty-acyl-phospholipid synthase-like methyltransferase
MPMSTPTTSFYGREREYLDLLLEKTSGGDAVLDLSCGSGCPMAEYVVSRGRRVIGIDQAESLLDMARSNLASERWILGRMEDYELEDVYGAAIVWDSLFHVARAEHESILRRVVRALPAGGRLMLTVGGSAHPPFTDCMFGERFFYDSHSPAETERVLHALDCRIVLGEFMNRPDGGREKGRYAYVVEKR